MVPCSAVRRLLLIALGCALAACAKNETPAAAPARASILLVTLDTTRADALTAANAPAFHALAQRGRVFRQAYATVPQTLPSHLSMFTGLYPAGHGVRENGRYLAPTQKLVAEELRAAGYRTAAFTSAFAVDKRFGIARGFDVYDASFPTGRNERPAAMTTDAAITYLRAPSAQPLFLWVHFYDPHYPYEPPEPYKTRFASQPYLGEVAAMDEQLGKLVAAFEQHATGPKATIVLADHGEGLGDHGEAQHGNLLYQSTMHIPLVLAGDGIAKGMEDTPVSARRVYHTIRDLAGIDATNSLRSNVTETIAAEAMKPFLDYGWQPQVMALDGRIKVISSGAIEAYDVIADPREEHDLASSADLSRGIRVTLRDYPIPSLADAATAKPNVSEEERKKLASLGYVAAESTPVIRKDAPRPKDMTALFPVLDDAAALFVREEYKLAIPLLNQILMKDPNNLDAALRLATSYSSLGDSANALSAFRKAQAIAPDSPDVRTYLALHYARGPQWQEAVPLLERVLREAPDRLPALEALAVIRERQNRIPEAIELRKKIYSMRSPSRADRARLGELQMMVGDTDGAIASFEAARPGHDLELGVLYLAARRYDDARTALDRVPPAHPGYSMALFKRAQVSVLLREPDARARIDAARQHADATTRELIAKERLFR